MDAVWTHIIADLYECDFSQFISKSNPSEIMDSLGHCIQSSWLKIVWKCIHVFGEQSFTLAFILAESHVTVHTWPEKNYVSLDIFACNYSRDNNSAWEKIFNFIAQLFCSKKIKKKIIYR